MMRFLAALPFLCAILVAAQTLPAKTVHVKDFGFDATNSTRFVQQAIDSDADTVVIDARPEPWRVSGVELRSNKRLVFAKGSKVLSACVQKNRQRMFRLFAVTNVVVEGESSDPQDSYIGFFETTKELHKVCRPGEEMGSGIAIDRSTNVVVRNLHVARCGCDGVYLGGSSHFPSYGVLLENLDLEANFRQGCSIVIGDGITLRRIRFRDTIGTPPCAGLDLEPNAWHSRLTNILIEDCEFANNNGGGLIFALCSNDPIDIAVRRCKFVRQDGQCAIDVPARGDGYVGRRAPADVNILIEDCEIETRANEPAVRFGLGPIYSFVFRNVRMRETGGMSPWNEQRKRSPIEFGLDRDLRSPDGKSGGFTQENMGRVVFENVSVTGYAGPFVRYRDALGAQSVSGYFRGVVDYNGTPVDTAKLNYVSPDTDEPPTRQVAVTELAAPGNPVFETATSNARLSTQVPWYQKAPAYTHYFYAKKGQEVGFTVTYPEGLKKRITRESLVLSTVGGDVKLGALKVGANVFAYTATADGWCSFRPPCQGRKRDTVSVSNVRGTSFAWQSDTLTDSNAQFLLADKDRDYVGYFEVPPHADCHLRVTEGDVELRDASGRTVDRAEPLKYFGRHDFHFRASGDKPEIWSFRAVPGSRRYTFRFYAPLNGIWADSPEALPRMECFNR